MGLVNCDLVCYANVVLQCLRATGVDRTLRVARDPLVAMLSAVLERDLLRERVDATDLVRAVSAAHPGSIAWRAPNDASEFYMLLADDVAEKHPPAKACLFGEVRRVVACDKCGHTTFTKEPLGLVSVPLSSGESVSSGLTRAFAAVALPERRCDACGHVGGEAVPVTTRLPDVFVVLVQGGPQKSPALALTLACKPQKVVTREFRLCGAVVHVRGHYWCVVTVDSTCYKCDDEQVTEIPAHEFVQAAASATMLFYARVP